MYLACQEDDATDDPNLYMSFSSLPWEPVNLLVTGMLLSNTVVTKTTELASLGPVALIGLIMIELVNAWAQMIISFRAFWVMFSAHYLSGPSGACWFQIGSLVLSNTGLMGCMLTGFGSTVVLGLAVTAFELHADKEDSKVDPHMCCLLKYMKMARLKIDRLVTGE